MNKKTNILRAWLSDISRIPILSAAAELKYLSVNVTAFLKHVRFIKHDKTNVKTNTDLQDAKKAASQVQQGT